MLNASLDQFSYWYISIFLMVLGVAGVIGSRYLSSIRCNFLFELRDPIVGTRLRAVLDRREALEGLGRRPIIVASISYFFFGLLCLLHVVTPAIAYALACADVALMFAWMFARVRNRSQRRAASLAPRRQIAVVPPLAFVGALLVAAVPLVFVTDPNLRVPALLVCVSSLAIVVSAWSVAGMAAVLVGDDADLEVYADERIRRSRVCSMLALAYAVVPVFVAVVTRDAANLSVYNYAFVTSMILTVMFTTWCFIDFMQRRAPRPDGT